MKQNKSVIGATFEIGSNRFEVIALSAKSGNLITRIISTIGFPVTGSKPREFPATATEFLTGVKISNGKEKSYETETHT